MAPRKGIGPQPARWQRDPDTGEEYVNIPEVCGPVWWANLHSIAENIRDHGCASCGGFAVDAIGALHDAVNVKLGKPVRDPANLAKFAHIYEHAAAVAGKGSKLLAAMGQDDDPWGSRCRDPLGRFTDKMACGFVTPEAHPAPPTPARSPSVQQTFAIGPNGTTRYEFEWAIRDLGDLIASHDPATFEPNPEFPQVLQPRLRARAANRLQVETMAASLDPASLLEDFHSLDRGAPIIGPDSIVESGNGRVMALTLASVQHPEVYRNYKRALSEIAPRYGLTEAAVKRHGAPALVRIRLTEVDRRTFVEEANASATLTASAIEQARSDAAHITVEMLGQLDVGESESIDEALRATRNASFVTRFLGKLAPNERARLVDAEARLNQDGLRRVTSAIFVRAFPGEAGLKLAERAFETLDQDVRTVINGVARALGPLAQAEALIEANKRPETLAIGHDLAMAVPTFARIKRTPGQSVADYLNQSQLFERELTPFQETVLRFLDQRSRSAKKIGVTLRAYAEAVIKLPPPEQGGLFDTGPVTKEQLWSSALKQESIMAQRDPRKMIDWCNTSADQRERLWNWRSLRDAMLVGVTAKAVVSACSVGFLGSEFQISFAPSHEKIAGAMAALGSRARQVREFGTNRLIYAVVLPGEESPDLTLTGRVAVEPIRPSVRHLQPAMFQPTFAQLAQDETPDLFDAAQGFNYPELTGRPAMLSDRGPGLNGVVPKEFSGLKVQTRLVRSRGAAPDKFLQVTRPEAVQPLFSRIRYADREWLLGILLNVKSRVIGVQEVAIGARSAALVPGDAILRAAILADASAIILVHNHPSGDPTPSPDDTSVFAQFSKLCQVFDIKVVDMMVVGATEDYSIAGGRRFPAPLDQIKNITRMAAVAGMSSQATAATKDDDDEDEPGPIDDDADLSQAGIARLAEDVEALLDEMIKDGELEGVKVK